MEEDILRFWQEQKIFEKSLEQTKDNEKFSFYDGPPFITGLPHYGTLLPSISKDIIPRYQTMKGKYVRRVWGWDVHGLPAENKVEQQLGLKNKKDIEEMGIGKFVDACRQYVKEGSEQWKWYIDHIGRWVDMEDAYRTDQLGFMETVMWLFHDLYEKKLIYKGRRVSLYCPRCATPLSKFEVTMDEGNYRDVEDPAVTIAFKLKDDPSIMSGSPRAESRGEDTYLLAWTTTPWTLPANLALAIDPEAEYVKVSDGHRQFILAHEAMERYRDLDLEILETFKGEKLLGREYQPLYNFFDINTDKDFRVYPAEFVSMEDGTGIVHIAPDFGEDDFNLGQKVGLSSVTTLTDSGLFVDKVEPWKGQYYKKADPAIMDDLKSRELLIKTEKVTHSYPFCYRCGTPLIYKSQESWFMALEPLRTQLLENNKDINWVPKHFGQGRFAYNIENAPDWCLSRTRYWGSPIPVWQTEDGEIFVPKSIAELEELSGQKITDLHRPAIDEVELTLPSGKKAHRVKEVLDGWFESGAMPYGQFHYPFENVEEFEQSFPTDFIVEYTGQLRGWFYYLHVLSNALKGKNSFKNVAVTGVMAGSDGRKMSKSLGNYPDPKATMEKYGAESLRLYFMGSKIMSGEDIAISEDEIREQSRLLNILHNSFRYFITYANLHNFEPTEDRSEALIDRWMDSRLQELTKTVDEALANFDFQTATKAIRPFIEDLSTWYIRRNRDRFVSGDVKALQTLYNALGGLSRVVAPILPFTADYMFKVLSSEPSVHLSTYPEAKDFDQDLIALMAQVRVLVSSVHMLRAEKGLSLRQPLAKLTLEGKTIGALQGQQELLEILRDEVNVKQIVVVDEDSLPTGEWIVTPVGKLLLDTDLTDELKEEGRYRELLRKLQDARKKAGLQVGEMANLQYQTSDPEVKTVFSKFQEEFKKQVFLNELSETDSDEGLTEVAGEQLKIFLKKS